MDRTEILVSTSRGRVRTSFSTDPASALLALGAALDDCEGWLLVCEVLGLSPPQAAGSAASMKRMDACLRHEALRSRIMRSP
jgi:hypothetical protein